MPIFSAPRLLLGSIATKPVMLMLTLVFTKASRRNGALGAVGTVLVLNLALPTLALAKASRRNRALSAVGTVLVLNLALVLVPVLVPVLALNLALVPRALGVLEDEAPLDVTLGKPKWKQNSKVFAA